MSKQLPVQGIAQLNLAQAMSADALLTIAVVGRVDNLCSRGLTAEEGRADCRLVKE